jgi:hypothetical protein
MALVRCPAINPQFESRSVSHCNTYRTRALAPAVNYRVSLKRINILLDRLLNSSGERATFSLILIGAAGLSSIATAGPSGFKYSVIPTKHREIDGSSRCGY